MKRSLRSVSARAFISTRHGTSYRPTLKGRHFKLNKARTLNSKLSVLRKLLKIAVARGGLDSMPAMPKQRRIGSPKVRYFSPEEEAEMLSLCSSEEARRAAGRAIKRGDRQAIPQAQWDEFREMLIVLIDTGMRWGENFATRKQHIDRRQRELRVIGISGEGDEFGDAGSKNGEERLVGLTTRALDILTRRAGSRKDGTLWSLDYPACYHMFQRLRRWMGLANDKHFTIHVARHTFCSRLVQNGVDVLVVKELAGHKDIKSTLVYAHLAPKNRQAAIKVLDAFNAAGGAG